MLSDCELQNDEMLALESIFDAEELSFRKENEECTGLFNAFVALPDEIKITYGLREDKPNIITVKFLPPIELFFTLPFDYPSTCPPSFTLVCSWLGHRQISHLCSKLDTIWNENKGSEILYLWMSFLKEESFGFLKLETAIDLSKQYFFNLRKLEQRKSLQRKYDSNRDTLPDSAESSNASGSSSEPSSQQVSDPTPAVPNTVGGRGMGRGLSKCGLLNPEGLRNVNIQEHHTRPQLDPRAVSCESLQTALISYILEWNKLQTEKEFKRNIYPCMICFEDKPGNQCVMFYGCGHIFCRECVGAYFEVIIRDGNVHSLTCPKEGCNSEALQSQIADLVPPELFARYDELLLSSTLDKMEDIVYCPRRTCQYPVTFDKADSMAQCAHCSYTFCSLCRMGYHGIENCKLKMDKGLIAEYESGSEEKKQFLEKKYGRKTLLNALETAYSVQWMKSNSKPCPHCQAPIEKSDGCNKMTCWKCNTFFCWICNTRLIPTRPYNHFDSPTSPCFQMLFVGLYNENGSDEEN